MGGKLSAQDPMEARSYRKEKVPHRELYSGEL